MGGGGAGAAVTRGVGERTEERGRNSRAGPGDARRSWAELSGPACLCLDPARAAPGPHLGSPGGARVAGRALAARPPSSARAGAGGWARRWSPPAWGDREAKESQGRRSRGLRRAGGAAPGGPRRETGARATLLERTGAGGTGRARGSDGSGGKGDPRGLVQKPLRGSQRVRTLLALRDGPGRARNPGDPTECDPGRRKHGEGVPGGGEAAAARARGQRAGPRSLRTEAVVASGEEGPGREEGAADRDLGREAAAARSSPAQAAAMASVGAAEGHRRGTTC